MLKRQLVRAAEFMDHYGGGKRLSVSGRTGKIVMMEPNRLSNKLKPPINHKFDTHFHYPWIQASLNLKRKAVRWSVFVCFLFNLRPNLRKTKAHTSDTPDNKNRVDGYNFLSDFVVQRADQWLISAAWFVDALSFVSKLQYPWPHFLLQLKMNGFDDSCTWDLLITV